MSSNVQKPPILQIQDLKIGFRSRGRWVQAVEQASIVVQDGEGVAVIGESGSGKTLTMMSSLALIPPNPGVIGGSIVYHDGKESISLLDGIEKAYRWEGSRCLENYQTERWRQEYMQRARYLAGLRIGIIFQNPIASLDPLFSVGTTLMESIALRNPALTRAEKYEEAVDWLDRVHIKNPKGVMQSYPHQLSGGMCQRVMIAATLAMRPRIIIADEPTTGLDMTTKAQILYLLHEARSQFGSSLIFVTHEIGLVTGLTERVVVMRKGLVVDEFATARLAEVCRVAGEIQAPADLAPHTRELLVASLKLEEGSPEDDEPSGTANESPSEVKHHTASDTNKPSDVTPPPDNTTEAVSTTPEFQVRHPSAKTHRISDPALEHKQIQTWQKQQSMLLFQGLCLSAMLAGILRFVSPKWFVIGPVFCLGLLLVFPGLNALKSNTTYRQRSVLAGIGFLGIGWWMGMYGVALLACLLMALFAVSQGHHLLQTIHKHRIGYEHIHKARWGKWLGVVSIPAILWMFWF